MESVKESLADISEVFHSKLAEFKKEIHKSPSTATTATLASEFLTFRKFMIVALNTLQQQVKILSKQQDSLEVKRRRKFLLLHGAPETEDEDPSSVVAEIVTNKLKVAGFSTASISRCHRLGRPLEDQTKSRPVLIKFREVPQRDKVWFGKTKLKGSGITLSEFLTKSRHSLFMEARKKFGVKQCWTKNGVIYILAQDGSRHQVECSADLDAVPTESTPVSPAPAKADDSPKSDKPEKPDKSEKTDKSDKTSSRIKRIAKK